MHLDDGMLRRIADEPELAAPQERAHLEACEHCRRAGAVIASEAAFADRALMTEPCSVDAGAGYGRWRSTARPPAALWGAVAAALVALAIFAAPLGSYAESLLSIFVPKRPVALAITPLDASRMRALPDLQAYGRIDTTGTPGPRDVRGRTALSAAGFLPRLPAAVPRELARDARYAVTGTSQGVFTFDAERTRTTARRLNAAVPALPAGLDGTRVGVTLLPAAIVRYGAVPESSRAHGRFAEPFLVFAQARTPQVTTRGASLAQLEAYLLAQPGISPGLAAQIRAIGNAGDVLPIPVQVDRQSSRTVEVDGVRGLAIGDNTGLGAGVVWVKNGMAYALGGTYALDRLLVIAASLR